MRAGGLRIWTYAIPALCLALLLLATRALRTGRPMADAPPRSIRLLCGAGMRPPVEEIVAAFERRTGTRVEVQYGPSEHLLGQLELTGLGDVFLPGDAYYTEQAARRGWVAETRLVAWFVPVIQIARGNPQGIAGVADLGRPGLRLAVGDERAAAIGRITPELFRMHGVAPEAVRRNTVFTAVTAPELGQSVALGHADAALNWGPVAFRFPETDRLEIPRDRNLVSPIEAAVLSAAREPDLARRFLEFLTGAAAREAFRRHEYELPDPAPGNGSGDRAGEDLR